MASAYIRLMGDTTRQASSVQRLAMCRNSSPLRQLVQFGDDRCNRRADLVALFIELRLDDAVAVENEDDRPGNAVRAIAGWILRIAQLVEVDHFGFRIG